jgi:hypothetical protein
VSHGTPDDNGLITGRDGKTYTPTRPRPVPQPDKTQPDPGVTEWLNSGQRYQDAQYIAAFTKTLTRADDFMRFDAQRLARIMDNDHWAMVEDFTEQVIKFAETGRQGRRFRVVEGG